MKKKKNSFYPRFERACKRAGRSPTNVVTAAGLSSCLVTAWKNGASPNLESVKAVAAELKVPVADFI